MFCAYCGANNPDNARFCGNCGAAIEGPRQSDTPEPVRQPNPAGKRTPAAASGTKKSANWVIVLVLGMFIACGSFAIYATSQGSSGQESKPAGVQSSPPVQTSPVRQVSAEYKAVFEANGLDVPTTDFFATEYSVSAYAGQLDGGIVENMEFEHENDIVLAMVDTVYVPVREMDEVSREQLHIMMMDSLAAFEQMDCCIVTFHKGADFYVYRLEVMDMDDADNVHMISSAGIVSVTSDGNLVGIAATEENLVSSGYVKR